jgi:hypothetical protein
VLPEYDAEQDSLKEALNVKERVGQQVNVVPPVILFGLLIELV